MLPSTPPSIHDPRQKAVKIAKEIGIYAIRVSGDDVRVVAQCDGRVEDLSMLKSSPPEAVPECVRRLSIGSQEKPPFRATTGEHIRPTLNDRPSSHTS